MYATLVAASDAVDSTASPVTDAVVIASHDTTTPDYL